MFNPKHHIWKFANAGDELDDWLYEAENLVKEWSGQDKVIFKTTWQIILASYLLLDDLLPLEAKRALSMVVIDTIVESDEKKLTLNSVFVTPPPRGRKEDRMQRVFIFNEVRTLLSEGISKTKAYELIAEQRHKSPDTIRRIFERAVKKTKR